MSKRISLLITMCLCMALFVGCGKEAQKEPVAAQPIAEVEESTFVVPEVMSEDDKNAIKALIDPLIPAEYKTDFYMLDILTSTSGGGGIVAVQIESSAFADEKSCVDVIKSIVSQALGDEKYKDVYSFQFTMLAESQVTFMINIDDAQKITTEEDVSSNLSIVSLL